MKPKTLTSNSKEEKPPGIKNLVNIGSFLVSGTQPYPFYPRFFHTQLQPELQQHYSTNGHFNLLKSIKIQVVSDLYQAQQLWQEFSPQTSLFDTWEFRLAFYQGYQYQPFFLVLKTQSANMALLPLWYETSNQKYFWFGSAWQEENRFLVKDELFIPLLLAVCPRPILLNAISADLPLWIQKIINFKPDDPKYILSLNGLSSADDYLANLKKKKRYNLKRDRRLIEEQQPKIIINRFKDFNTLVELSKKRFHQKGEDTDWDDPRRVNTFKQVISLGQKQSGYDIRMLTVTIAGQIAAVDLIALYKHCYYPIKCGYDVLNFPGIGNYVNLLEIDDAISLNMKKMDFLEIGYGWKDKWFSSVPLLQYEA